MPKWHCHLKPNQKTIQARFGFNRFILMGSITNILPSEGNKLWAKGIITIVRS